MIPSPVIKEGFPLSATRTKTTKGAQLGNKVFSFQRTWFLSHPMRCLTERYDMMRIKTSDFPS